MIKIYGIPNPSKSLPWAIRNSIIDAMDKGMQYAASISRTKFLSGMGRAYRTLNVRSGRLRSSVIGRAYRGPAGFIATGELSSDTEYSDIHEFGGTVQHPGGVSHIEPMTFFSKKKGKWIKTWATEPHTITIPARPYLQPAIDKASPHIEMLLNKALEDALRKA